MENMSPELINGSYQTSSSPTTSQGNSTAALFSLVLVKILRLVLVSFFGDKNNRNSFSDGVEPRKNINDLNSERISSYHDINRSLIAINRLHGHNGSLVYGEGRGFWNKLNLPSTIPEVILALQFFRTFFNLMTDVINLVLNKYRLDRDTIEELNKKEETTTQSSYSWKKSRNLRIIKPESKSHIDNHQASSEYLTTLSSKVESALEKSWKI